MAVCGFKEVEKHVEFSMDPDKRATACADGAPGLQFVGDMGRDVISGQVLDASGKKVGMFRAFRLPKE